MPDGYRDDWLYRAEEWLIASVDETIVPNDEGNGDALLYNLVHLLRKDGKRYHYEPDQDAEIESWRKARNA